MRVMIVAVAFGVASLGLSACQQSHSDAQEATPVAKKDLGRPRMMYQGQGDIVKVDTAAVEYGKDPGTLVLKAKGEAAGPGYTDAQFIQRIYPAPPADGVYEVDVVATKPASGAGAATPIEVKGDWSYYPKDHLKAVRFMTASNNVTIPLPAPETAKK
jgi:hypothetical protein